MFAYIAHERPLSVLVVDDVPDVRLMLRAYLIRLGGFGPVTEAAGGLDAVAQVADDCPDAVVLDFKMPDLDGIETARRIKARCRHTKIVLFSAYLADDLFVQAEEAGVDVCLSKMTTPDVVAEMIKNLCAS